LLATLRCEIYLATRPEIDGKRIVVQGGARADEPGSGRVSGARTI